MTARQAPVAAPTGQREWIDKKDPFPSSTLIYRSTDGGDVIVRAELPSNTPGALIELGPWPGEGFARLTPDDARALALRINRMADLSDQGRRP